MSTDTPSVDPTPSHDTPPAPSPDAAESERGGGRRGRSGKKGGRGRRNKGEKGKDGGDPQKRYSDAYSRELPKGEMDKVLDELKGDNELFDAPSKHAGSLPADVFERKESFIWKADAVLARREEWKSEAEALRKKETLSSDERARQAVLMERLTLSSHYERFNKIVDEIEELDAKIEALHEAQREDVIRLRTVREYPEVNEATIKEQQTKVADAQTAYDNAQTALEANPNDAEAGKARDEAKKSLEQAKSLLESLPHFETKREAYKDALIARLEEREEEVEKEEKAEVALNETLKKVMDDLAILEHRAGDLEDPPTPEGGSVRRESFAYRLEKDIRDAAKATGKAAKAGGRLGYIGGTGALAVTLGALSVPFRVASVQLKRLYHFAMDPMSAMKGFDRIGKFYKDGGAWNGTGEAIQWILMGDPEPEKKHDKK